MNVVRGLIDWKDYKYDGVKILDKLNKNINMPYPVALEGDLSNNAGYHVFILNKNPKRLEIIIDIVKEDEIFKRNVFIVTKIEDFLRPYIIQCSNEKYILKFNIDNIDDFFKDKEFEVLSRFDYNYINELIVWYDFNNEQHLIECLYLFLINSSSVSNSTYDLLKSKLNYFGYDKDFMLKFVPIDNLSLHELDTKELCKKKLLSETLFELIENTFIHNYDYCYSVNDAKAVYEKYLNVLK